MLRNSIGGVMPRLIAANDLALCSWAKEMIERSFEKLISSLDRVAVTSLIRSPRPFSTKDASRSASSVWVAPAPNKYRTFWT